MKLTIKDIIKFIPFGLNILVNGKIQTVSGICTEANEVYTLEGTEGYFIEDVIPLLNPLIPLMSKKIKTEMVAHEYFNELVRMKCDVSFLIDKGLAKNIHLIEQ